MKPDEGFISEEDLATFDGWMRYQRLGDPAGMPVEQLKSWREAFEDVRARVASTPKVGLMKLKKLLPGEFRYAVAFRESSNLWLTLWIRRNPKREWFVFIPRGESKWDAHTSYHKNGNLHLKSYGLTSFVLKRQPLTRHFQGTESLGIFGGHGPKSVGAVCDPNDFSGVVEVGRGVLGPKQGVVIVDLVEPGRDPVDQPRTKIITRQVFRDTVPSVVITLGHQD